VCYFLQFRQACNLCWADRTSINPKKLQLEFLVTHFSDWLGKDFEIPAYEKNRIFEVKSVVGFYRDNLLSLLFVVKFDLNASELREQRARTLTK